MPPSSSSPLSPSVTSRLKATITGIFTARPRLSAPGHEGEYEFLDPIKEGGMGMVWRVRQRNTGKIYAAKVLSEGGDERQRRAFAKEKDALRQLNHPHIIRFQDEGDVQMEGETKPFFVMDLLEGATLHEVIQGAGWSMDRSFRVFDQLLVALRYSHSKGVIHRDIKPSNIMIRNDDTMVLFDFGIALIEAQSSSHAAKGTAQYMSPEQVLGKATTDRSDVYSCGVVLYEMLARRLPFEGTPEAMYVNVVQNIPKFLSLVAPQVPLAVSEVIHRCLAKYPVNRPDIVSFERMLRQARANQPVAELNPIVIQERLRRAKDLFTKGDNEKAQELLNDLQKEGWACSEVLNLRRSVAQTGNQQLVQKLLSDVPQCIEAGEDEKALKVLEEVLQLDNQNTVAMEEKVKVHLRLAAAAFSRRNLPEVRKNLDEVLRIDPRNPEGRRILKQTAVAEEKYQRIQTRLQDLERACQAARRCAHYPLALRQIDELLKIDDELPNGGARGQHQQLRLVLESEAAKFDEGAGNVMRALDSRDFANADSMCDAARTSFESASKFLVYKLRIRDLWLEEYRSGLNQLHRELNKIASPQERRERIQAFRSRYPHMEAAAELDSSTTMAEEAVDTIRERARTLDQHGYHEGAMLEWAMLDEIALGLPETSQAREYISRKVEEKAYEKALEPIVNELYEACAVEDSKRVQDLISLLRIKAPNDENLKIWEAIARRCVGDTSGQTDEAERLVNNGLVLYAVDLPGALQLLEEANSKDPLHLLAMPALRQVRWKMGRADALAQIPDRPRLPQEPTTDSVLRRIAEHGNSGSMAADQKTQVPNEPPLVMTERLPKAGPGTTTTPKTPPPASPPTTKPPVAVPLMTAPKQDPANAKNDALRRALKPGIAIGLAGAAIIGGAFGLMQYLRNRPQTQPPSQVASQKTAPPSTPIPTLTPVPASIAKVMVDGNFKQVSLDGRVLDIPAERMLHLSGLADGEHTMQFQAADQPQTLQFRSDGSGVSLVGPIVARRFEILFFQQREGKWSMQSTLPEGELLVDGVSVGKLPSLNPDLALPPGDHKISLRLPSTDQSAERTVHLDATDKMLVWVRPLVGGFVRVRTNEEAEILLGEKPYSRTYRVQQQPSPIQVIHVGSNVLLSVRKDGFTSEPPNKLVTIQHGRTSEVSFQLKAKPKLAFLKIQMELAGVQVKIDGKPAGETDTNGNLDVGGLEPGEHRLEWSKATYKPRTLTRKFVAGEQAILSRADTKLESVLGTIALTVIPPAAKVSIRGKDGVERPVAPGDVQLETGTYTVSGTAPNYLPKTMSIVVGAGQRQTVRLTLDPVPQQKKTETPVTPTVTSLWAPNVNWIQRGDGFQHAEDRTAYLALRNDNFTGTVQFTAQCDFKGRLIWMTHFAPANNTMIVFNMDQKNLEVVQVFPGKRKTLEKSAHGVSKPTVVQVELQIEASVVTVRLNGSPVSRIELPEAMRGTFALRNTPSLLIKDFSVR